MNTRSLIAKLSKKYPKRLQESYDNCGLQCGKLKKETNNILLCLDFDEIVYQYILENNLQNKIDLIITHHPFIFGTKRKAFEDDEKKKALFEKIINIDIPIFSFHTCFDNANDGMNDALSEKLGLVNIKPLQSVPMARGGDLRQPMDIIEFSKTAKNVLNVDYGLLINYGKKVIKNVAIVGGGGWYKYKKAAEEGYDLFISGDMPHHARRDVVRYGYNYLDLPHEIEKIFMSKMEKVLKNFDSSLNIIIVDQEKCPLVI